MFQYCHSRLQFTRRVFHCFQTQLQVCTWKICCVISMKNVLQNFLVRSFRIISSVWFNYFFSLFFEIKTFLRFNWLILDIFSFRIYSIDFFRSGNLSIRGRLRICICIMSLFLLWKKISWFSKKSSVSREQKPKVNQVNIIFSSSPIGFEF